jgi:hypothetical protein
MRFTCWITKATDTHTEYVKLMFIHSNNYCTIAPPCYVIRTLPVVVQMRRNLKQIAFGLRCYIKHIIRINDMIWYDIFVNCNWVATRWQQYSTRLRKNDTQNDTKQTIYRPTQKFWKSAGVPHLCGFWPGFCLTTEGKARKHLSQGSRRVPAGTVKVHKHK